VSSRVAERGAWVGGWRDRRGVGGSSRRRRWLDRVFNLNNLTLLGLTLSTLWLLRQVVPPRMHSLRQPSWGSARIHSATQVQRAAQSLPSRWTGELIGIRGQSGRVIRVHSSALSTILDWGMLGRAVQWRGSRVRSGQGAVEAELRAQELDDGAGVEVFAQDGEDAYEDGEGDDAGALNPNRYQGSDRISGCCPWS
jgi:hypothetical protein